MLFSFKWPILAVAAVMMGSSAYSTTQCSDDLSRNQPKTKPLCSQFSDRIFLPTFGDPRYPAALKNMLGNPQHPEVFLDFIHKFSKMGSTLKAVLGIQYVKNGIQVICQDNQDQPVFVQVQTFFEKNYKADASFYSAIQNRDPLINAARTKKVIASTKCKTLILDIFNPKSIQHILNQQPFGQYTLTDNSQNKSFDWLEFSVLNIGTLQPTQENHFWLSLLSTSSINSTIPAEASEVIKTAYKQLQLSSWSKEDVLEYDEQSCDPTVLDAYRQGQLSTRKLH